ncbi:hypothetical protein QTJ16_002483 [Diplocarpon rosae]|uniref:Uncharacterized protein n=1 Tax=Diplocarpon rosae TaxID=946125 RepID=A0AAD9T2E8_9HELO|nr:hypothetical protein QTJ16_002483 [Diplocarpon rosae]
MLPIKTLAPERLPSLSALIGYGKRSCNIQQASRLLQRAQNSIDHMFFSPPLPFNISKAKPLPKSSSSLVVRRECIWRLSNIIINKQSFHVDYNPLIF